MSKQTLEWFQDHEMSQVICVLPNKDEKTIDIMSENDAKYYFEMQDRGYTFKKKVTIHQAVESSCQSCEG